MLAANAKFDGKVFVPDERPTDLHAGDRIILYYQPAPGDIASAGGTAGDLLNSPIAGMWADRTDINDSLEFARELRRQAESRDGGQ